MQSLLLHFLIISGLLAVMIRTQIATIDTTNDLADSGLLLNKNSVGVSLNFSQIYSSAMNSTIFQGYFSNSRTYNGVNNQLFISVKMSKGFKFNCSSYSLFTNSSTTCTADLSSPTLMTKIGRFFRNAAAPFQASIGWDMEASNFANQDYANNFINFNSLLYSNTLGIQELIELVDRADQYPALGVSNNYTLTNFFTDANLAQTLYPYAIILGPGITESANASWWQGINQLNNYAKAYFTIRCVIFKNQADLTISNLLSDNSTSTYLQNRIILASQSNYENIAITEIKLYEGSGINGVTNSLAAAIWAIQISIEFNLMGGVYINFFADISGSTFQSILGASPSFTPSALYYGLMMISILQNGTPAILLPVVYPGSSMIIKSYVFKSATQLKVLILNKDLNASLSGNITILAINLAPLQCIYLTGPTLSETTNITLAGYSFVGGNSTPVGNYTSFFYQNINGSYSVPISYAQVALCTTQIHSLNFPRKPKSTLRQDLFKISLSCFFLLALSFL